MPTSWSHALANEGGGRVQEINVEMAKARSDRGSGRIPCTCSPGPRCTDPMYLVRRDNGPIDPRWGAGTSKRWSNPVRLAQWCLSLVDTSTQYQYDVVGFKNTSGSMQCYTVTLTNNNGGSGECSGGLFGAAYLDDFDPNSLCTNYAFADTGFAAITTTASFSFNVPTGRNFFIVVEKFNAANVNACQYTFTLSAPSSGGLYWHDHLRDGRVVHRDKR